MGPNIEIDPDLMAEALRTDCFTRVETRETVLFGGVRALKSANAPFCEARRNSI